MKKRVLLLFALLLLIGKHSLAHGQNIETDRPNFEVSLSASYTAWMPGAMGGGFMGIPIMADFKIVSGRWLALGVTGGLRLASQVVCNWAVPAHFGNNSI